MQQISQGDCLQVMKTIAENSVDALITDPPYALSSWAKNGTTKSQVLIVGNRPCQFLSQQAMP